MFAVWSISLLICSRQLTLRHWAIGTPGWRRLLFWSWRLSKVILLL